MKVNTKRPADTEKNARKKKKIIILLIATLIAFSLYQLSVHFGFGAIIHIYCVASGVLAVAYIFYNRGMLKIPSEDDLSDDYSREEKKRIVSECTEKHRKSEFMIYILFPLIVSVMLDLVYIFITENL